MVLHSKIKGHKNKPTFEDFYHIVSYILITFRFHILDLFEGQHCVVFQNTGQPWFPTDDHNFYTPVTRNKRKKLQCKVRIYLLTGYIINISGNLLESSQGYQLDFCNNCIHLHNLRCLDTTQNNTDTVLSIQYQAHLPQYTQAKILHFLSIEI